MAREAGSLQIEQRRPVWSALSSLFLDTDTSLLEPYIVDTLSASPYSVRELQEILIDEVYPVCHLNLFSVAGEWAGFDEDWLERRIVARLRSPLRGLLWLNLGRLTVPMSLQWRRIRREVSANRLATPNASEPPGGNGGRTRR